MEIQEDHIEPKIILEWNNKHFTIEGKPKSVEDVYKVAKKIDDSIDTSRIIFLYKDEDDEDDWIKVETQDEFKSALKFAQIEGNETLHFFVVDKGYEQIDEREKEEEEDEVFFTPIGDELEYEMVSEDEKSIENIEDEKKNSDSQKTGISKNSGSNSEDKHTEMNKKFEDWGKPRKEVKMTQDVIEILHNGQYPSRNNFNSSSDSISSQNKKNLKYEIFMLKKYFDFKLEKIHQKLSNRSKSAKSTSGSLKETNVTDKTNDGIHFDGISRIDSAPVSILGSSIIQHVDPEDKLLSGIWKEKGISRVRKSSFGFFELESKNKKKIESGLICDECNMNLEKVKGYKYYCLENRNFVFCGSCTMELQLKYPQYTFKMLIDGYEGNEKSMISKSQFQKIKKNDFNKSKKRKGNDKSFKISKLDFNAKAECRDTVSVVNIQGEASFKLRIQNTGDKTFLKNTALICKEIDNKRIVEDILLPRLRPYDITQVDVSYKFKEEIDQIVFNFFSPNIGFFGKEVKLKIEINGRPPEDLSYLLHLKCRSVDRSLEVEGNQFGDELLGSLK